MRRALFDDLGSVIHLIVGGVVGICVELIRHDLALIGIIVSLVATISFILYQLLEIEDAFNKLGDFIEFLVGYVLGNIVGKLLLLLYTI